MSRYPSRSHLRETDLEPDEAHIHTHTGNTFTVITKQRRPTVDGQNLAHPQGALRRQKTRWSNNDHHDPHRAPPGSMLRAGKSGRLDLCKILSTQPGVTQGCVVSTNIKQEWVSGELHTLRSDVAPNKPVQDYVHQLSCGRRSKGCPNPASLVLVGFELAMTHHI